MADLPRLFIRVRFLLILPFTLIIWGTAAAVVSLWDHGGFRTYRWIGVTWTRFVLMLAGTRFEVAGLDNLRVIGGPYIVVMNHQSYMDIPVIVQGLPFQVRFVAKRELLKIPFFGSAARRCGNIFIERSDRKDAMDGIRKAGRTLKELGVSVVLAPEGTRSEDGKLLRFKKGAFVMAIEAGLPILPVTIEGTRQIMPKGSLTPSGGNVLLTIGRPVPTSEYTYRDRDQLADKIRSIMEEQLLDINSNSV